MGSTDREIADALSVTQRMVAYRVRRLLVSGAVQTRAVIDPKRQAGLVFYELELLVDPKKKSALTSWLRERHGEALWNLKTPAPDVILVSLFCFTLADPEDSVIETLAQDGVKRCFLFILKEIMEPRRPNWIDSLIELRINS